MPRCDRNPPQDTPSAESTGAARPRLTADCPRGDIRRVLRAPHNGILIAHAKIGDLLEEGQIIAEIDSKIENRRSKIISPFKGILRGLIRPNIEITDKMKIGDVDLRNDPVLNTLVSDKALAIGGGVLEAILTRYPVFREIDQI
ncbi:MAG: hypothetical protein IPJ46_12935 [Anaerolineales bacterium]|nr:hypothetical protein [Anaerolineales bacterium]